MPNFPKYKDLYQHQLLPIVPNFTTNLLGGIYLWTEPIQGVENMWGLDNKDLSEITYKGEKIIFQEMLWIRSDMCRLQQLLDVPTQTAVQVESMKAKFIHNK